MATSATYNATAVAHYVRVNLISLSFRVVRQAVVILAGSPKPAGRLWHSPHSARTLRSAGVRRPSFPSTMPPKGTPALAQSRVDA